MAKKKEDQSRSGQPQQTQPLTHATTTDPRPRWRLEQIAEQLAREATAATNALACVARAQYQHTEVTRLHIAIGILKQQLADHVGSASVMAGEASGNTDRSDSAENNTLKQPILSAPASPVEAARKAVEAVMDIGSADKPPSLRSVRKLDALIAAVRADEQEKHGETVIAYEGHGIAADEVVDGYSYSADVVRRKLAAVRAEGAQGTHYFICNECGPRVAVDEDGCCRACGADCTFSDAPLPPQEAR